MSFGGWVPVLAFGRHPFGSRPGTGYPGCIVVEPSLTSFPRSRYSVFGIITTIRAAGSGDQIRAEARNFLLLQIVHPAPYFMDAGVLCRGDKAAGFVKFTTDLSLLLRSYIYALPIRLDGVHGENFLSFADVTYINNKNTQIVVDCIYV